MYRLFDAEALPDLRPGDSGFMLSALTPVLYEQFPWQESIFEEVARTYALMVDGLNHVATDESPWVSRRLGLLDCDQWLVAPLGIVEDVFELCGRDVVEVAV